LIALREEFVFEEAMDLP